MASDQQLVVLSFFDPEEKVHAMIGVFVGD
jgi:hypothetical protein